MARRANIIGPPLRLSFMENGELMDRRRGGLVGCGCIVPVALMARPPARTLCGSSSILPRVFLRFSSLELSE